MAVCNIHTGREPKHENSHPIIENILQGMIDKYNLKLQKSHSTNGRNPRECIAWNREFNFFGRMTRAVSINKGGLIESRLFGKLPVAETPFCPICLPALLVQLLNFSYMYQKQDQKQDATCVGRQKLFAITSKIIRFGTGGLS